MKMDKSFSNLPRLYTQSALAGGFETLLAAPQAHYLKNVLRREKGNLVRLFNGRDGEFAAEIRDLDRRGGLTVVKDQIRKQPAPGPQIHLIFAPVKKQRMDFLIEKSVELGATALHPVLTARTETRRLNGERIAAQIIEAAEQCERMHIPVLHPLTDLKEKISGWQGPAPVLWCRERTQAPSIGTYRFKDAAFLIGPEGGFDETEVAWLEKQPGIQAVSLGESVLRTETAAMVCLTSVIIS
jgi:16S rRNA (uracil1498-N3)-methyltransferase